MTFAHELSLYDCTKGKDRQLYLEKQALQILT